jgi:predicted O-methyltransferase YrrM
VGIFEIAGDQTAKAFLPSCVPELKSVGLIVVDDVLDEKVDSDGGLDVSAGTL